MEPPPRGVWGDGSLPRGVRGDGSPREEERGGMGGSPPRLALRAEDIRAGYGAGDIIHGVSVSVAPRTVASVVGPNGSGKSTLMKALTGVIRLSSGRVLVGDRDISGLPPEEVARAGVGYVPQIDDVFPPLTVRENLEMGGYLLPGRQVSARIDHVVSVFPRLGQMLTRRAGAERRRAEDAGHGPGADAPARRVPAGRADGQPGPEGGGRTAQRARPGAGRSGRRGARRRAAGQGRTGHLRLHLRARRRAGADGRHPGAPFREPGVHRVLLRRRPPEPEITNVASRY